jgi:hypothetical protein
VAGDAGDAGPFGGGDIGREKLTEVRCGSSLCSPSFGSLGALAETALGDVGLLGARSKLAPRPLGCVGGGDEILSGASRLAALTRPDSVLSTLLGSGGIGGALVCISDVLSLPGDGDRRVRSVNEVRLSKPGLGLLLAELPDSRLSRRFVWTFATLVGGCGLLRRAAAAAAADNDALFFWLLRKASEAAEEATADAGGGLECLVCICMLLAFPSFRGVFVVALRVAGAQSVPSAPRPCCGDGT